MKTNYDLALQLGQLLHQRQWQVTTAESCTGGGLASAITDIPGSSAWFEQGFVTYSNSAKMTLLNVRKNLLDEFGAVSQPVVEAMAEGALSCTRADIAVAISGIAGPDGGSEEKPVGMVWIAWQQRDNNGQSCCYRFTGGRRQVRDQAIHESLAGLINLIEKNTV